MSYIPCLCFVYHLPHCQHHSTDDTCFFFLTTDEHKLTHHNPQFMLGLTLGVVHSMGLNKCIMMCELPRWR